MPWRPNRQKPISTTSAEIASREDSDQNDFENVVLNEEEAENAEYLINLVTGSSQDIELLIEDTSETEHDNLLDIVEDTPPAQAQVDSMHRSGEQFVAIFSKINVCRIGAAAKFGKEKLKEVVEPMWLLVTVERLHLFSCFLVLTRLGAVITTT